MTFRPRAGWAIVLPFTMAAACVRLTSDGGTPRYATTRGPGGWWQNGERIYE